MDNGGFPARRGIAAAREPSLNHNAAGFTQKKL